MAVLDDIRNGKGLKPISSNLSTCQDDNCIASGQKTETYATKNHVGEVKIKVETEGFEEAQQQVEVLADAYDGFPAQVTIKNCRDCTINIYPSQMKITQPPD